MNALGDYQTPPALARAVLAACCERGIRPARILEPTCGSGSFLAAAATAYPQAAEFIGVEVQRRRYEAELVRLQSCEPRLRIEYGDAYALDFAALRWRTSGPLLVVGNPPWITTAALGRYASVPTPPRSNRSGLRGLAARTGAANFDVAEFLLLKLLRDLHALPVQFACLVKESVARKLIAAADGARFGVTTAEIVRIDARAWFGVAVDACCLLLAVRPHGTLEAPIPIRAAFGGPPVAFVAPAAPLAGTGECNGPRFRQGIKHDAADVFELRCDETGAWRNGFGEEVDVEAAFVYPLRKARALHSGRIEPTALIVPQMRLGADTQTLRENAPRLWRYLSRHADRIAARKSSIYRSAPRFALFGVGPYSFAPWKVGVAGFYAEPRFRLIGPHAGRPVVLGDTAYFAPFDREADARSFARLAQSNVAATLLRERIVRGKRPVTKALLDSINWALVAART